MAGSRSCPSVTHSWQRKHLLYAVIVKGENTIQEEYLNPKPKMKPNFQPKSGLEGQKVDTKTGRGTEAECYTRNKAIKRSNASDKSRRYQVRKLILAGIFQGENRKKYGKNREK